jgi:transposase-like protein
MNCPRCKSESYYKNGFMKGSQRYKCKSCKYSYTKNTTKRGYDDIELKREVLRYYLEGIGFRRIERLIGVNYGTAYNWVKEAGIKAKEIVENNSKVKSVDVLELDELCTYVKKNKINIGSGLQWRELPQKYWPVMLALAVN